MSHSKKVSPCRIFNRKLKRLYSRIDLQHGRFFPLHEAVINGDAVTVEAVIVAGPKLIDVNYWVGYNV